MKRIFQILFTLTCTTLVACSQSVVTHSSSDQVVFTPASLAKPDSVVYRNIVFRGRLLIGNEVSSFIPCGTQDQYTLTLSSQLRDTLQKQTQYPYQERYGELIGYLNTPSQTGFNADYRAQLIVKQINFAADDAILNCSEPPHPTQALGVAPKWLVSIENKEMTFFPNQVQSSVTQQLQSPQQVQYQSKEGTLTLTPSLCELQQGGNLYGWLASAKTRTGRYKGCARVSSYSDIGEWEGEYQAQSQTTKALSIRLSLSDSHGAITRYRDSNTQSEIVERGYWQILNAKQIEVVMTQNQGQYLISRRIFTRANGVLSTDQEKIGHQLYPIRNGGMQLFKVTK